jgi:hypothetical protein
MVFGTYQHGPDTYQTVFLVFGFALVGKEIVLRFIIEYSSLRDCWPLGNKNLYEDF